MPADFPEPAEPASSRAEVYLRYLAYFRQRLGEQLRALPAGSVRTSSLPTGWAPIELVKHLVFVERRWLEWGFEGRPMEDPWGDEREGRWYVDPEESPAGLLAELAEQQVRSERVVGSHRLEEVGQPGPRWGGASPATLERVLLHLVQEYARHLGHLDIVVELAGAGSGE